MMAVMMKRSVISKGNLKGSIETPVNCCIRTVRMLRMRIFWNMWWRQWQILFWMKIWVLWCCNYSVDLLLFILDHSSLVKPINPFLFFFLFPNKLMLVLSRDRNQSLLGILKKSRMIFMIVKKVVGLFELHTATWNLKTKERERERGRMRVLKHGLFHSMPCIIFIKKMTKREAKEEYVLKWGKKRRGGRVAENIRAV